MNEYYLIPDYIVKIGFHSISNPTEWGVLLAYLGFYIMLVGGFVSTIVGFYKANTEWMGVSMGVMICCMLPSVFTICIMIVGLLFFCGFLFYLTLEFLEKTSRKCKKKRDKKHQLKKEHLDKAKKLVKMMEQENFDPMGLHKDWYKEFK